MRAALYTYKGGFHLGVKADQVIDIHDHESVHVICISFSYKRSIDFDVRKYFK